MRNRRYTYPASVTVVEIVESPSWPEGGTSADRDAYWAGIEAARKVARQRVAEITAEGKIDVVPTSDNDGGIDLIGAPADGVRRLPQYDGTDQTTRWGNTGIWWIEAGYSADGTPQSVNVHAYFETVEERDAAVARFPKSLKVKPSSISGTERGTQPAAVFSATLWADKVNGGRNETGIKRFRRLLELIPADQLGWSANYGNAFPNLASLLAVI